MEITLVLVVIFDTDNEFCETLKLALESFGYRVRQAKSQDEAFGLFSDGTASIIFCEILIPGGGGLSLLHRIRAHDPHFPIVLMAGHWAVVSSPLFVNGLRDASAKIEKTAPIHAFENLIAKHTDVKRGERRRSKGPGRSARA